MRSRSLAHRFFLLVLLAFGCLVGLGARAQITPPPRPPLLVVSGAERPVRLQALKVEVEVAGGVAETRIEMTFFNPNSRVLEGKLQFPLAAGQAVSGFALDVNGEMREAVPVDKARAEQVFEDIARRRVDPGLLQSTQGNNYELRLYPLNPGRTRTVSLTLLEPASTRLQVPLGYAGRVDRLDVALRFAGAIAAPEIASAESFGLRFAADPRGGFTARVAARDAALPALPLLVRSAPSRGPEVTTGEQGGERFFTLDMPLASVSALRASARPLPRALPKRVQIVWDASASGANRQIDRELDLLDAYFRRARDTEVRLVRVADIASPVEVFAVQRGDWSALRRALRATVYDGASQLGAVRHDGVSAESIWFTDGLANYGAPWKIAFPVPVYAVGSAASSDPAALRALAERTGGRSIDLLHATREAAAATLLTRGPQLADVTAVGARDLVVDSRDGDGGRFALAGVLTAPSVDLALHWRAADGTLSTEHVRIDAQRNPSRLAPLQWARLTLASLEGDAKLHTARMRALGSRFGMATRETSLLVLENVDDYVQHAIEPPPSLREAYANRMATAMRRRADDDKARLARLAQRFEARVSWWNRDFPKDTPKPVLQVAKAEARGGLGALQDAARNGIAERETSNVARPLPAPAAAAPTSLMRSMADAPAEAKARDAVGPSGSAEPRIAIALQAPVADSPWLKRLDAAAPADRLAIYFDERMAHAQSVSFFLEAAEFFLKAGQRETGLRVLSNLAEMDLQNRQVLRLLGYRLRQAGESALAVPVFERVLELAPGEPQSHRDLGLALADAGQPQKALERLYETVTGSWDGRFADIDLIALAEANAVIAKAGRDGRPLDVSAIDSRLLKNLSLDVRVVLAWDADATDVDLHVIDPNGEEVFYGHNLSYQGGTISHDATGGYGPEEFSLHHAKPGRYRIEAEFFGHRQQVLTSSTGLMLWLSSNFGTAAQQDRATTLQLKSQGGQRVVVGEFEVGG